MDKIKTFMFFSFFFLITFIPYQYVYSLPCGNIPEIQNTQIQDIAVATWYQGPGYTGPVIMFNPQVVSSVAYDFNAFSRTHEHSHICLGHVLPTWANNNLPPVMSQVRELETDAYATRELITQNQIGPVRAAYNYFFNQGTYSASLRHPPGIIRARNIQDVAASMGICIP